MIEIADCQSHEFPQFRKNEVHVWLGRLDVNHLERNRLASYLSAHENERAARFVLGHDRDHFAVARGMLRDLLGYYLNRSPETIPFEIGPYGKLSLPMKDSWACLKFNLAHSQGLALYAFAHRREVGIDIEKIRPDFAGEEVAERYFSDREQQELRKIPSEAKAEAFFLCWTRKEAYIKARGEGLQIPLDSFDVTLTPSKLETIRSADSSRWIMRSFCPSAGYIASIVAQGKSWSIRFREYASITKATLRC